MLIAKIILLSLAGAALCLDRIFIQIMVSRPIVIAPVAGFMLGNPYAGLIIGAILELFWIDRIPVGIYIPPNDSIAAVLAVSLAVLTGQAAGAVLPDLMALSVLVAIPFGFAVKLIDVRIVQANNRLSDQALEDAKAHNFRAIERKVYWGLARVFVFYVAALLTAQAIGVPALMWLYPRLPAELHTMLKMTFYFLPLLGIAVALNTFKLRGAVPVFCAIFLAVAVILEILHVF